MTDKMKCGWCYHEFEYEPNGQVEIECPNCGGIAWSESIYKRKDLSFMHEVCRKCEKKKKVHGATNGTQHSWFYVCDCSCGHATLNGAHPLSPCRIDHDYCVLDHTSGAPEGYSFYEDEDLLECYTDEYAIMEGHRCSTYIAWLVTMRKFNGQDYKYPEKFKNPL